MIWYIPMDLMDISGYEFFLLALLSPLLLAFPRVREFIHRNPWFSMVAVVGLPSYLAPNLVLSIIWLSIGVSLTTLIQFASIYSEDRRRERVVWSMMLAIVVILGLRLGFSSIMPIFRYTEVNIATLIIGIIVRIVTLYVH